MLVISRCLRIQDDLGTDGRLFKGKHHYIQTSRYLRFSSLLGYSLARSSVCQNFMVELELIKMTWNCSKWYFSQQNGFTVATVIIPIFSDHSGIYPLAPFSQEYIAIITSLNTIAWYEGELCIQNLHVAYTQIILLTVQAQNQPVIKEHSITGKCHWMYCPFNIGNEGFYTSIKMWK